MRLWGVSLFVFQLWPLKLICLVFCSVCLTWPLLAPPWLWPHPVFTSPAFAINGSKQRHIWILKGPTLKETIRLQRPESLYCTRWGWLPQQTDWPISRPRSTALAPTRVQWSLRNRTTKLWDSSVWREDVSLRTTTSRLSPGLWATMTWGLTLPTPEDWSGRGQR